MTSTTHENQRARFELLIIGYLGNLSNHTIQTCIIDLITKFYNPLSIPPSTLISFPFQLSPQKKQYLISGFIRKLTSFLIPELIKLCLLFYDEVYHWLIDCKQLEKLQVDEKVYSQQFSYDEITFKYSLIKRINKFTKQMVFSKHIELITAPKFVKDIALYSEIYCPTNNDRWKSTRILLAKSKNNHSNIGSITEQQVQQNSNVSFVNIMKIVRIDMEQTHRAVPIMFDKYYLNAVTKFEWSVDRKYLEKCRLGQTIFSPNSENNTFTMQIRPFFREAAPNCLFGVRLLVLPRRVKKIDTTVIYSNSNMDSLTKHWIFSYTEAGMGHIMGIEKLIGKKRANPKVTNVVFVTVHDVYDMNDQRISRDDWQEYGVYY